jgi:hypothetical protein
VDNRRPTHRRRDGVQSLGGSGGFPLAHHGSAESPMESGGLLATVHDNRYAAYLCSDGVWVFQVQVGVQGLAAESPCGQGGIYL